MKEQLISFETAKLAKEKGFNITNRNSYDENTGLMLPLDPYGHCYALEGTCPAPTQSLLQKWLREEYKLSLEVFSLSYHNKIQFTFNIKKLNGCEITILSKNNLHYDSHGEALEAGLVESLKLI